MHFFHLAAGQRRVKKKEKSDKCNHNAELWSNKQKLENGCNFNVSLIINWQITTSFIHTHILSKGETAQIFIFQQLV